MPKNKKFNAFLVLTFSMIISLMLIVSGCGASGDQAVNRTTSGLDKSAQPSKAQTGFATAEELADHYAELIRQRDAKAMLELAQVNASDDYLENWKNLTVKDVSVLEIATRGNTPFIKFKIELADKDGLLFYDEINIRWLMIREIDSKWVALSRLSDRPPFG